MVPGSGMRLFDGMYEGLGNAIELTQARQTLTASNLANVNTPGYLAKEIFPFETLLNDVMEKGVAGEVFDVGETLEESIAELAAPAGALDGNSVDLEREAGRLVEDQVYYQALAGGVSRRLAMLRFAAADGKM
ncbi:MAG: hypothetical protein EXR71_08520 [Myxococcales bacterium]|nr:hypothetical protein [Myxococcales bacterium]